jgi:hypothetical protein
MSELTEDRTQRHFEAYQNYMEPSPRFGSRKLVHHDNSPQFTSRGPPSYIINVDDDAEDDQDVRNSGLGTIHGRKSAMSLPPGGPMSAPRVRRQQREIPRSGSSRDAISVSTENRQRLSVAQKARLEAEHRTSTPVRARLDEKTQEKLTKKMLGRSQSAGDAEYGRENSSQQSGLWRRMEEAVLGPRPEDMSSEEDDRSNSDHSSGSNRSTHVTDFTEATRESDQRNRRRESSNQDEPEEKKVAEDVDSLAHLSLQERSRLQRAKQLEFLKNQGLIKNEQDLRGGAGASPSETGSVGSSNVSFPRSAVSFPGTKRNRRQLERKS